MTTLNNIEIPTFANFGELSDFAHHHKDKVFVHFITDDGKIQQNCLLSHKEEDNDEYNALEYYHCMSCENINDTIRDEAYCPDCHPELEDC